MAFGIVKTSINVNNSNQNENLLFAAKNLSKKLKIRNFIKCYKIKSLWDK